MKNIIIILFVIALTTSVSKAYFEDHSYIESFVGSYRTIALNGVKVYHPSTSEPTTIKKRNSVLYYIGMDEEHIPGIDIKAFQYKDPNSPTSYYSYHPVFLDRGKFFGQSWEFKGPVRIKIYPPSIVHLDYVVTLRRTDDGLVQLTVEGREDDYKHKNQTIVFTLERW